MSLAEKLKGGALNIAALAGGVCTTYYASGGEIREMLGDVIKLPAGLMVTLATAILIREGPLCIYELLFNRDERTSNLKCKDNKESKY